MKSRVAEKILEDAEQEVRKIQEDLVRREQELAKAHQHGETQHREKLEAELEDSLSTEVNRLLAMTGLEMKKERLKAKTAMVEQVLDQCRARIRNDKDLYVRFLKAMVVKGALTGHEEVLLSGEDLRVLGSDFIMDLNRALEEHTGLKGNLRLTEPAEDLGGGLILKDGPIAFNATLSQAVRTVAERCQVALVKTLFPEE